MYDKLIKSLEYILCDYSTDDKDYCCGDVADGNIITTLPTLNVPTTIYSREWPFGDKRTSQFIMPENVIVGGDPG